MNCVGKVSHEDFLAPDEPPKCRYDKNDLTNNPHPVITRNIEQKIYPNILHCIGNTPMVKLNRIPQSMGITCDVLVKCEFLNPAGSVKDRIAYSMIQDAEKRGLLKPGYTMIEPTSGNTGIAMAMIAAVKGYQSCFVFPEKSSLEKENILNALGGKVVRCSDKIPYDQPGGVFCRPTELQREIPNSVILNQFHNSANPLSHYYGTSLEIIDQCDGKVDMVAFGVGTGGTMSGIGRRFKEVLPECIVVGVDPYGSTIAEPASLNDTEVTYFEVEGIGHNYFPTTLDKRVADLWVKVSDNESMTMTRRMYKEEGLLCGGSSGTILCGALKTAKSLKEGQKCVVILPDGIGNYLTKVVSDYWMEMKGFIPSTNTLNHWWWDYKVSLLNPKVKVTISNVDTCQKALDLMESHSLTFLPVIDSENNLQGIVTSKNIMKQFFSLSVEPDDLVEKTISENYNTVTTNSTLGVLSRVLDNEDVAIVVDREIKMAPNAEKPKLIGVILPADFLEYIAKCGP